MRVARRSIPRPTPRRRRRTLPFLAATALGAAGCADAVTSSADTSIDGLRELVLAEELRVGSVDDPEVGFSQIADIEVGEDGTMYVLERQARQVRVYDPTGALVRRFGRQGDGPGELRNPAALGLLGDTLAVTDVGGDGRITFFGVSGNLVRAVRVPPLELPLDDPGVRVSARPFRMRSDGRFDPQMSITRMPGAATDRTEPPSVPRIVFDREGRPVDTTGWSPLSDPPTTTVGGVTVNTTPLLTDGELIAQIDADSVIVRRTAATASDVATFTVTRVGASGDTVFDRRVRYTPVAVTPAHRDSLIEERLGIYRNRPVDVGAIRGALATELVWPAFHPPVKSVRAAKDGALWLLLADGTDTRWLVLDADGSPRGTVTLPATLIVHESDGDRLWGVEHDALDVPWLVRYRLEGG